jgi:tetratricopeptide (TPR) repeat protein
MIRVSKLALAITLSLGATALSTVPAQAQKNKKDADVQLNVGEAFRKPAAAAETAVKAKDWATAETQIAAAEAQVKNEDEKYYAASLRFQLEYGRGNEAGQIAPLQVLVVNPKTPPESVKPYTGHLNFLLGKAAVAKKDNAATIQYLTKARENGATQIDIPLWLANAYSATGKNAEAVAETRKAIDQAKAGGQKAPAEWYEFAIPKINALGDRSAMASWAALYVQDYPTTKNWNTLIRIFGLEGKATTDRAAKLEKLDRFRLMRATKTLANRSDYADYAYTAQSSGLPWEAISVIDEGRANGKLPATDADANRTYAAAKTGVTNSPSLDALAKQGGVGNADALLGAGKDAEALALYDAALAKGGDANEINLHRGIALQRLGRKDEAKAAFALVKSGPLADHALLWTAAVDYPPSA